MNGAHWHLLLNHLPVLGVPFGLLLLVASIPRLNHVLQRAGLVVLILAGGAAGFAYVTGEPAEESLERVVAEAGTAIEAHEEAATAALVLAGVLGALAVVGLWRARRAPLGRGMVGSIVVLAVVTSGSLAWVANLGGQIRHSEIRAGDVVVHPAELGEEP